MKKKPQKKHIVDPTTEEFMREADKHGWIRTVVEIPDEDGEIIAYADIVESPEGKELFAGALCQEGVGDVQIFRDGDEIIISINDDEYLPAELGWTITTNAAA